MLKSLAHTRFVAVCRYQRAVLKKTISEPELLDTIVSAILFLYLLKHYLIMNNIGYILDTTLSVDLSILAPSTKICPKVNESLHTQINESVFLI